MDMCMYVYIYMWYNMSSHLTGTRLFHMGDGIIKPSQSVGRKAAKHAKATSTRNYTEPGWL